MKLTYSIGRSEGTFQKNVLVCNEDINGVAYEFSVYEDSGKYDESRKGKWHGVIFGGNGPRSTDYHELFDTQEEAFAALEAEADRYADVDGFIESLPEPHKGFIKELMDTGCKIEVQGAKSIRVITPTGLHPDCSGSFLLSALLVPGGYCSDWNCWYLHPDGGEYGIGEIDPAYGADYEYWARLAGTCDRCRRYIGADNLYGVAFANKSCEDCYDDMKRSMEYPGWNN